METSLEVAERHRQEARRLAGGQRPGSHQPGTLWAKARPWSCRDTGGPRFGKGGSVRVSVLPGTGTQLSGLGRARVVKGTGPLCLSFQ